MPATACPSWRFAGTPRAIPGPLRAKGTCPLGTPDRRRRAVSGGQSLGFNSRSPRRVTPRRLSLRLRSMAPHGSPSLRLRSPAPLHSSRMGFRYTGHARYVFRATEYLARPKPGCANRSEVTPAEPCNSLAGCCTDPEIWSQRSSLPPSMLSRASSHAARMASSTPLAVNLMIRPVERLTA